MKEIVFTDEIATTATRRRPWYRLSVRQSMGLVFALGCVFGLLATLAGAVQAAREAARRSQCVCNFCQITLAIHNYHETYGVLPPAHVDDAAGRPMHSWRVLILPFMEQTALYNSYNMSEPWNSPGNSKLLNMMPNIYACPSRAAALGGSTNLTSYVVLTGPRTAFPDGKTVTFGDITDGTAKTVLAVEVANVNIPWTQPVDLDVRTMSYRVNDPKRPGISSWHPHGANVSFADGGKRFMREGITAGELRALFTIDGGEEIDVERALSHK